MDLWVHARTKRLLLAGPWVAASLWVCYRPLVHGLGLVATNDSGILPIREAVHTMHRPCVCNRGTWFWSNTALRHSSGLLNNLRRHSQAIFGSPLLNDVFLTVSHRSSSTITSCLVCLMPNHARAPSSHGFFRLFAGFPTRRRRIAPTLIRWTTKHVCPKAFS